jgi:hypothetical protein
MMPEFEDMEIISVEIPLKAGKLYRIWATTKHAYSRIIGWAVSPSEHEVYSKQMETLFVEIEPKSIIMFIETIPSDDGGCPEYRALYRDQIVYIPAAEIILEGPL